VIPLTKTGVILHATPLQICGPLVVPIPSWPELFAPQHATCPSLTTAQETSAALTCRALVKPLTSFGLAASVVVPSPTAPYGLFPQHRTDPSVASTQVTALLPAEICGGIESAAAGPADAKEMVINQSSAPQAVAMATAARERLMMRPHLAIH
jgi:hypothetical protein